jgi:hypothetical protein
MNIAPETKKRWQDKVKLRDVMRSGKQVQDQMDQVGVSSEKALVDAITYCVCMALLFLIVFGSLAMRAIQ